MNNSNSSKMFYTIGEVEKIVGIKQHVIRQWEKKIPSIAPIRHNKRRLYSIGSIDTLKKVKEMIKCDGFRVAAIESAIVNKSNYDIEDIINIVDDLKNVLLNIKDVLSKYKKH